MQTCSVFRKIEITTVKMKFKKSTGLHNSCTYCFCESATNESPIGNQYLFPPSVADAVHPRVRSQTTVISVPDGTRLACPAMSLVLEEHSGNCGHSLL